MQLESREGKKVIVLYTIKPVTRMGTIDDSDESLEYTLSMYFSIFPPKGSKSLLEVLSIKTNLVQTEGLSLGL